MYKFTIHPIQIDALSNQAAYKVLPSACQAMQRQDQGFLGVCHVASHSFQDYGGCQMLAKELFLQSLLQICVIKMTTLKAT